MVMDFLTISVIVGGLTVLGLMGLAAVVTRWCNDNPDECGDGDEPDGWA